MTHTHASCCYIARCPKCRTEQDYNGRDWRSIWRDMQREGWRVRISSGKPVYYCGRCIDVHISQVE